jgi:hypothetical protein
MGASVVAQTPDNGSFTLRNLPLASRVLLAAFLISVGIGYVSAMVQLHVQHASPGQPLPTGEDVIHAYHGSDGQGTLERLITANETLPFNGSGQMRAAFTTRSSAWVRNIRDKAKAMMLDPGKEDDMKKAESELRKDRELEIASVVEWIKKSGKEDDYTAFILSEPLAKRFPEDVSALGKGMFERSDSKQVVANIQNILSTRCWRCHSEGKAGAEGEIYLNRFEVVQDYTTIPFGGGMSLRKLAQSTHVHLLGFAMLYAFTGLVFSLTSYPAILRLVLSPFPLIMQIIDISCWWLARLPDYDGALLSGPNFARTITVTGGLVATGLVAQIVLGCFNLFDKKGRFVLIVLFAVGAALAGMLFSTVISPHLALEALQGNGK